VEAAKAFKLTGFVLRRNSGGGGLPDRAARGREGVRPLRIDREGRCRAQPRQLPARELPRRRDARLAQARGADGTVDEPPGLAVAEQRIDGSSGDNAKRSRRPRSSSTRPPASMASKRAAIAACSTARSDGSSAARPSCPARRRRCAHPAAPTAAGRSARGLPARAGCVAHRSARAAPPWRIDAGKLGVQRRPSGRGGARVERGARRRVGRRQRRQSFGQRLEVEHRAADQQRQPAAGADCRHRGSASARKRAAEYAWSGSRTSIRWCGTARVSPHRAWPCRRPCRGTPAPSRR